MEEHITQLVGIYEWVENGEYPNNEKSLKRIIEGICHNNASKYFDF